MAEREDLQVGVRRWLNEREGSGKVEVLLQQVHEKKATRGNDAIPIVTTVESMKL